MTHIESTSQPDHVRYDALTTSNKVSYQNALNAHNLPFAKACGSVLTNYCWKESDATASIYEALRKNFSLQHTYFGIDVWAQNTTKLSHPRITYPEYGGGGTNTGVAVAKLAELGISAGIFAPAWTFEHFPGHGRGLEQTVWDGADLPEGTICSCGDSTKRHQPNELMSITSFARHYNAGSERFFFTDFSRGFSLHGDKEKDSVFGGLSMHAQLGSQSVLPIRAESVGIVSPLQHHLEHLPDRTQLVVEAHNMLSSIKMDLSQSSNNWLIPLFKLDMPADGSLRLRISYRDLSNMPQGICFYLKISGIKYNLTRYDYPQVDHFLDVVIGGPDFPSSLNPRLEELGFYSNAFEIQSVKRLAEMDFICIQPITSKKACGPSQQQTYAQAFSPLAPLPQTLQTHGISKIHLSLRGEGATRHLRLCWDYTSSDLSVEGIPYSRITGPFSYFLVCIDDLNLGRAYATERILPASLSENMAGREVSVKIEGVGFDGQKLANATTVLQF